MGQSRRVSTGVPRLDDVLQGGIPERRGTLVIGGPGTGKSTLGMDFLQEGLDRGQECLHVSTEQTPTELRDSFEPFEFDLDHPNLDLKTLHAAPRDGRDGEELVLRTLQGGADIDEKQVPFTGDNIVRYLQRSEGGDFDRIVLDSVSGLEPASASIDRFRRTVMDLIRLFSDEFQATGLFLTEADEYNLLSYNAHGVLRLTRECIDGDYQRFIQVDKMRGIDHDTRSHLFEIGPSGVRIIRRARDTRVGGEVEQVLPTGIGGLDTLLGGGLVNGHATVFEHDGLADRIRIVNAVLATAFEADWAVAFVPPMDLHPAQLARLFEDRIEPMEQVLDDDRFFVIDPGNVMDGTDRNVFSIHPKITEYPTVGGAARHVLSRFRWGSADRPVKEFMSVLETVDERRNDRPLLLLTNTQTLNIVLDPDQLRQFRHRVQVNVIGHDDSALFIHNPSLLPGSLAEFYADNAAQVLHTWLREGSQYIKLRKGPSGHLHGTRYVEPIETSPFVRVQASAPDAPPDDLSDAGEESPSLPGDAVAAPPST
jgi:circadian clock protein KaiC